MPLTWTAIVFSTLLTALRTPLPPYRFASPSRSSSASCFPVDAPEGTIAVALPDSVYAVTDTVGLPRESSTSCALRRTSRITSGKCKRSLSGGRLCRRPRRERQPRMGAESVVQQRRRIFRRVTRGVEDDGHQVPAIPGRGGNDAASGFIRQPRLEARGAWIAPQHRVQVVRGECLVLRGGGDGDLLGRGDRGQVRVVLIEVCGDVREVVRRHAMPRRVEPARVDEMARRESDAARFLVHLADEAIARHDSSREGLGSVIS